MKKKSISKLTPEQEAAIPKFRDKWLQFGLSTDRLDEAKTIKVVTDLYLSAGLEKPEVTIHESPMACLNARYKLLSATERATDKYRSTWTLGSIDAYWLAFYEFGEYIGVEYTCVEQYNAYKNYAKNAGIMYAYEGRAFVSQRPTHIKLDEQMLAHCQDDLAVRFSDGYGFAAWHGVRIPREWVLEKSSLTPKIALKHPNMEQRKAACEIIGWENVLRELNVKTINKHENPAIGELLEVDLNEAGVCRFVRAQCGTGRMFCFEVNPKFDTALEANSDTYKIDPKLYEKMRLRT